MEGEIGGLNDGDSNSFPRNDHDEVKNFSVESKHLSILKRPKGGSFSWYIEERSRGRVSWVNFGSIGVHMLVERLQEIWNRGTLHESQLMEGKGENLFLSG